MSCKCKNKCECSGGSSASTDAFLAQIQDQLQEVMKVTGFLKGHPILIIDDADDIAFFDFGTGEGFENWEGWAVCDGQSHYSARDKKTIQTPNYIDRFVVMAGGTYTVGDTGGSNTVALVTAEMPSHSHPLTDPGHNHAVTDTGHDHGVTDPGHEHVLNDPGHTHIVADHSHPLNPAVFSIDENGGTGPFGGAVGALVAGTNYGGLNTNVVSQSLSSENTGINMDEAFTGIDINPAFTGVAIQNNDTGITIGNTGSGTAHENRPPFWASIYVKYIG